MAARQLVEIRRVAAADHARNGNPEPQAGLEYQALAPPQPALGEREPTQPVVDVGVDPGVVEHDIRADLLEQPRQMLREELFCLCSGKLVRQCIEKVNTRGSSRKIAAVPSP